MIAPARALVDSDDSRADPVGRTGTTIPDSRGDRILFGLGREVSRRAGAPEQAPRAGNDLVVAGRARIVGRQVLAAGLTQNDRVGDRPAGRGPSAGPLRHGGGLRLRRLRGGSRGRRLLGLDAVDRGLQLAAALAAGGERRLLRGPCVRERRLT